MDFSIEDLRRLGLRVSTECRDYEPWADMIYWSGGGDHGTYDFPIDLRQVERIDITMEGVEGSVDLIPSSSQVK